jgi:hypothetical protein
MINGSEFAWEEDRIPVHIAYEPNWFDAIGDAMPQSFQTNGYDIADQIPNDMTRGLESFNESEVCVR